MATHICRKRPALLRFIWWDDGGRRHAEEFRLAWYDLTLKEGDYLPNLVAGSFQAGYLPTARRLELTADLAPLEDRSTLAQRLADAVLEGDDAAAYALADDLFEQRVRPEGFVERAELVAEIAALRKDNANLAAAVRRCEEELEQADADSRYLAEQD